MSVLTNQYPIMENIDPIFVKISENLETDDILDDLKVTAVDVKVGEVLNIGGRNYTVHKLRDEKGKIILKKSDLNKNIKAYNELLRTGVIANFQIDDLCLVNNHNGDVLVEVTVPPNTYQKTSYNHLLHSNQRNFFVRLDSAMLNTQLVNKKAEFDEIKVKLSPCMFASDSAIAFTENGKKVSITERGRVFESKITSIETSKSFTLYEREVISRLIGATNLLALNGKVDKVVTVLPRGAYYTFLFQAAEDGYASPEMVLDWFDRVDARVKFLSLLIKKGIHQYYPQMEIEQYSFMDSACDVMRAYFRLKARMKAKVNQKELFGLVLNTMIAKDSFARQAFNSGIEKPQTFPDLADLTFAITNLLDMEIKANETPENKLLIGVYDISETMMWTVARKLRNRGLLEFRGQFNPDMPQKTTYDNLSYIGIMPIEHVIFDISPEFAEQYMGGFTRLYSVRKEALTEDLEQDIIDSAKGMVERD